MMKKRKYSYLFVLMFLVLSFNFNTSVVDGVTIKRSKTTSEGGTQITGSGWGDKSMTYKGIDKASNRNAFCTTFNHPSDDGFVNGAYTTARCDASGWFKDITPSEWIVSGQIVDIIDKSVSNSDNKYVYTVLTLNTFFHRKGITGAVDFINTTNTSKYGRVSNNLKEKIGNWIASAKEKKDIINASKDTSAVPKPTISNSGSDTLSSYNDGQYYMSGTINFTQSATSLPIGSAIHNAITVSQLSNATVQICASNGTACESSKSAAGTYRIKVIPNGTSVSGIVTATIKSQADSFSYKKGVILCHTTTLSNQAMLITQDDSAAPSNSNSITLSVPTQKEIQILKVNENGEKLSGAEFKLTDSNGSELTLKKNNEGNLFSYSSTDDILGKKFVISEIKTPSGYKTNSSLEVNIPTTNGSFCYKYSNESLNGDEVDIKYCDSVSMCQVNSDTPVKIPDDGDCNSLLEEHTVDTVCVTNDDEKSEVTKDLCEAMSSDSTDYVKMCKIDGELKDMPSDADCDSLVPQSTVKKVCTYNGTTTDDEYCSDQGSYNKIEINGNSVLFSISNERNTVKISKKDATGKEEVVGASLKICTEDSYKKDEFDCTAAKNSNNAELSWVSTSVEKTFRGVPIGTYYIIETIPPSGYKLTTTATKFTIDENGKITIGDTELSDDTIVINNALNEMTISKTDIVTSKEISGAQLSICLAAPKSDVISSDTLTGDDDDDETETSDSTNSSLTDEEDINIELSTNPNDYTTVLDAAGNCIPVILQDGSGQATWTSDGKPHTIMGLPTGIYYLVETTAPRGYATTESILFKMTNSGQITDIAGNPINDNKIVMKDAPIVDVKTGTTVIAVAILFAISAGGLGIYYYTKTTGGTLAVGIGNINDKIRKRKIHK